MQRLQAYKFELRPNGQQQRQMRRFAGACRFVFNAALAMQTAQHQAAGPFIRYVAMAKHLTAWRQGAALPSGRTAPWLAEAPIHPLQHALKDLERAMSRKVKFSRNWGKARARVQRVHARIARVRADFLHKATTTISKNHALVCVEDLAVRNMSRSAVGTVDAPGRNVRAKSGLNKAILDQGWSEFRRQLEYKLAWSGGHLIAVPPANTSRTCPACGQVAAENRPTQARFLCVACGHAAHADVVGAINILARGHRAAACGEPVQSGRSMKQEPAEAI